MKKKFRDSIKMLLGTMFIVLFSLNSFAQNQVSGTITAQDGTPLIGATVAVKGTTRGAITDTDGRYSLEVSPDAVLVVSYVGYETQEINVAGRTRLDITLSENIQLLDEIVIVGYATGNARSISGSVERITSDDMNSGYVPSPIDAINGKVAGLTVTSNGGNVNERPTLRLRGLSSLSGGNDPLVIIDGAYASVEILNNMSSQDIQEITVLKDASETAQYGSRGAAGVIIVSTKKAKEGIGSINYDGQFGLSTPYKELHVLTADQWRATYEDILGSAPPAGKDLGNNTNWSDWIQNNPVTQNNHVLSFTRGTQTSNMLASIGVNSRMGQVRTSGNTTYTARLNASQIGLGDKLKLELNLLAYYTDQTDVSGGIWTSVFNYNPTYPSHRNPVTGLWDIDATSSMATHPGESMEIENKTESYRVMPSTRASLTILDGLTLSAFGSYNLSSSLTRTYTPNDHYQQISAGRGSAGATNNLGKDWLANAQLTYVKEIGKHSINVLGLVEGQSYYSYRNGVSVSGFETNVPRYNNFEAASTVNWGGITSNASQNNILSYMGRLNYMFNKKYVITLNARADGSSKLGANNKWGFFPSASAAWIVSNEDFMMNQNLFSTLKLRVSYGITGNQDAIQAYNSLQLQEPNLVTTYAGKKVTTYHFASNENPDLKWETKYTFDVGMDITMLNNRLRGTFDFYKATTKDLLYTYQVPSPPFVFTSLLANMGEMTNTGFEASLSGDVLQRGDWGLTAGGNMAWQKNVLNSLNGTYMGQELSTPEWIALSSAGGAGHTSNTNVTYMAPGYTVGLFRLPVHAGFDTDENGKRTYAFQDLDGNGVIDQSDNGDRKILGQVMPKVTASVNLRLTYKNFDLSSQIRGAYGHMIYNYTELSLNNMNQFPSYNVLNTAPGLGIYQVIHTSYWLEKGDYTNIEYITVGYNIPTSKLKNVSRARVALSANNIRTITKYHGLTPMINSANPLRGGVDSRNIYPIMRTYTLQLSVSF